MQRNDVKKIKRYELIEMLLDLSKDYEIAKKENEELKLKVDRLETRNRSLNDRWNEMNINSLIEEIRDKEFLVAKLAESQSIIENLTSENDTLKQELHLCHQENNASLNNVSTQNKQINENISHILDKQVEMLDQIHQKDTLIEQMIKENTTLLEKNGELKKEIEALFKDKELLIYEINDYIEQQKKYDTLIQLLQTQKDNLQEFLLSLQEKLEQLEKQDTATSIDKETLDKYIRENEILQANNKELKEKSKEFFQVIEENLALHLELEKTKNIEELNAKHETEIKKILKYIEVSIQKQLSSMEIQKEEKHSEKPQTTVETRKYIDVLKGITKPLNQHKGK